MQEDPVWFDEPEEASGPRSGPRRAVVVAIAAIPWVLVAALVLLPGRSVDPPVTAGSPSVATDPGPDAPPGATEGAPTQVDPVPPSGSDHSAPAPPRDPPATVADPLTPRSSVAMDLSTRDALAAVATVVARAWLTGVSPHLDVPGLTPIDPASYAEHVVVEAIDQDDPHLAVVSVLAVLLRETSEGLRVETRRVAVPLAITDGRVQPAGEPWWLPRPDLRAVDLPVEVQTDPAWFEAAAAGLREAGLRDVEVATLERTDRWPWRAHITARTPDGQALDGPVWLRWNGQGFELAGHVPATDGPRDGPTGEDRPTDEDGPTDEDDPAADDDQEVDP